MEKPINHRYQEIEAFPQVLNKKMWNWSTRMVLQEAREPHGGNGRFFTFQIDQRGIGWARKTLRGHENWLSEWVPKAQRKPVSTSSNDDVKYDDSGS